MRKFKNEVNDIKASSESILKKVIGFIPTTRFERDNGNDKKWGIDKFKLESRLHLDRHDYAFIKLLLAMNMSPNSSQMVKSNTTRLLAAYNGRSPKVMDSKNAINLIKELETKDFDNMHEIEIKTILIRYHKLISWTALNIENIIESVITGTLVKFLTKNSDNSYLMTFLEFVFHNVANVFSNKMDSKKFWNDLISAGYTIDECIRNGSDVLHINILEFLKNDNTPMYFKHILFVINEHIVESQRLDLEFFKRYGTPIAENYNTLKGDDDNE